VATQSNLSSFFLLGNLIFPLVVAQLATHTNIFKAIIFFSRKSIVCVFLSETTTTAAIVIIQIIFFIFTISLS